MPQTEKRNLELTPPTYCRDSWSPSHTHTVYFELDDIVNRFNNTFNSIKSQFDLEEQLELSGDAHQADYLHTTSTKINIARTDVEKYIEDIEKIVLAIYEKIQEKNNN